MLKQVYNLFDIFSSSKYFLSMIFDFSTSVNSFPNFEDFFSLRSDNFCIS